MSFKYLHYFRSNIYLLKLTSYKAIKRNMWDVVETAKI
jgi:hypothetical protein